MTYGTAEFHETIWNALPEGWKYFEQVYTPSMVVAGAANASTKKFAAVGVDSASTTEEVLRYIHPDGDEFVAHDFDIPMSEVIK